MFFKLVHQKEIHVLKSEQKLTLSELQAFIRNAFKSLPKAFTLAYKDADGDSICIVNEEDLSILLNSGVDKVRVQIHQSEESFFDETQQILIKKETQEEKPQEEEIKEKEPSVNLDDSISEKIQEMVPHIISQIKEEVIKESKIKSEKEEPKEYSEEQIHKNYICDGCGANPIKGPRHKCVICRDFDLCDNCEATIEHPHPLLKIKNVKQAPRKLIAVLDDDAESIEINGQKFEMPGLNQGLNFFANFMNGPHAQKFKHCAKNMAEKFKHQCQKYQQKQEEQMEKREEKKGDTQPDIIDDDNLFCDKKEEKKEEKQNTTENAKYLQDILGVEYSFCAGFAEKNPTLTKEQLLEKYFENV